VFPQLLLTLLIDGREPLVFLTYLDKITPNQKNLLEGQLGNLLHHTIFFASNWIYKKREMDQEDEEAFTSTFAFLQSQIKQPADNKYYEALDIEF
jgi:hypothetical protein